jgi:type III secretion protein Q
MNALDAHTLSAAHLCAVDQALARTLSRLYQGRAALAFRVHDVGYEARCEAHAGPSAARAYRLMLGDAAGWLLLDAAAERAWLGDAAPAEIPHALRSAVLADALAPLAQTLEQRTGQAVQWLPEAAAADIHLGRPDVLQLTLTRPGVADDAADSAPGATAWSARAGLLFDHPQTLVAHCPATLEAAPLPLSAFMGAPVPLHFELGGTLLSRRDFAAIALGDILRIEKWMPAGAALRCVASVRGQLRLRVFGLVQGSRIVVEKVEETPMTSSNLPPAQGATQGADQSAAEPASRPLPADSLDDIELVTTFELEERRLSLAELRALRSGTVFELEQPLNQAVISILANGMPVGEGHLIAVGNRLGVRVSRFIGQPLSEPEPQSESA